MSDPFGPGADAGEEPSEEEVRAYLGQLRVAPAGQVVAEVLSALLNAAQVKLGRRDGRLLLDLTSGVLDGARPHLPDELVGQVDGVLGQLRMAQVDAEREVAQARAQGQEEPGDLDTAPPAGAVDAGEETDPAGGASPSSPPRAPSASAPPKDPPATSRLWVPGR